MHAQAPARPVRERRVRQRLVVTRADALRPAHCRAFLAAARNWGQIP
jgi:hypothetical protein